MPRKPKTPPPDPLTPYERLAYRIRRQIMTPRAQTARRVDISRAPSDPEEAWDSLLDQLADEEYVTMSRRNDGSVRLAWTVPDFD